MGADVVEGWLVETWMKEEKEGKGGWGHHKMPWSGLK